jgi:hypothetical protein
MFTTGFAVFVMALLAASPALAQTAKKAQTDADEKASAGAGDTAGTEEEKHAEELESTELDEAPDKAKSASEKDDDDDDDDDDDNDDDDDDDDNDDNDEDDGGLHLKWGGVLQSDLRFRMQERSVGGWYNRRSLPVGVARNENQLGGRLAARYGRVSLKADITFVIYGFIRNIQSVEDLSYREVTDPYRFEANNLYMQVDDLLVDGLDLRVGQQLVQWGTGDQFNPTNNLNADDVEDVLRFGDQQGNFMVRADYWINRQWSLTGVLVPVFRPALLPRSGPLALVQTERLPFTNESLRLRVHSEQAAALAVENQPTVVTEAIPVMPERNLENMQVAYRIGGNIGGQDVSLSYYYGRHDFPVPLKNVTTQDPTSRCNPADANDCIGGTLQTQAFLHYPKMHVYGFNMSGALPWLRNLSNRFNSIGYRIEAALVVPKESRVELQNDNITIVGQTQNGEYDYNGRDEAGVGQRPIVVASTPFPKWTIGLDYFFNQNVYLNVQWVHGFPDEFGAGSWITKGHTVRAGGVPDDSGTPALICASAQDGTLCAREMLKPRINDYLVTGIDFRFLRNRALIRLFTILDLTGVTETRYDDDLEKRVSTHHSAFSDEGFSAVIYPEVNYDVGYGLELGAGAIFQFGKEHSKFGDPATGGHLAWTRARFTF